ncbi:MAG: glycosyltransferase family 4 protein [Actinomycetota bacterium]
MKIAHLCLSNFFVDGYRYQENELVREHVRQGHDVVVIASCETYDDHQQLTYVQPREYVGVEGARVVRVPYRRGLPLLAARKLRMHPGIARRLDAESPDVVMFHSLCGAEVLTAARWAAKHDVVFNIDSHEDRFNSARTSASRLLHRFYYRPILQLAGRNLDSVLCISLDTIDFVHEMYGLERTQLEFFPLGGQILDDAEYGERRARCRESLGIGPTERVLLQSGKFGARKKLPETLVAFTATSDSAHLLLAGTIAPEVESEVRPLIDSDPRVRELGWCDSDGLTDLLCAADVYVQPGTQSVTMQQALCCRNAVILDDVKSHGPYVDGNGWLVSSSGDLAVALDEATRTDANIDAMSKRSLTVAEELLDYAQLAVRVLRRSER